MTKSQKCLKEGQKALRMHNYKAAHSIAIARLTEATADPAPFYLLAHIAEEHGNTAKAEELFQHAASLGPDSARYLSAHAKILSLRGKQDEARQQNERASDLLIDDAHVADTIGVVFSRTGFHEKAVPFYEKAISLNPKPDNFHFNLAASLRFLGKFEKAETSYRDAISKNPDNVRAYSSLGSLRKQTKDDNALEQLYTLFEKHEGNSDNSLHIGHAIAKTLEDLGRHSESLDWLGKAKARKRAVMHYNMDTYFNIFDAARKSFQSTEFSNKNSDLSPIFIIGLPRTGTTLVDRIISSHPDVISCGELNTFASLVKTATNTPSRLVMDAETFLSSGGVNLTDIGREYWKKTQSLRHGHGRMTDKMPLNFFYAGLLYRAFPNARIVCLRRGAMDSCLSNYRQLFSTSYSYYNYTLSLEDIASYYREFVSLMEYWKSTIPSSRFMQIQYENIIFEQKAETQRLLTFCDLTWNDACMNFHENKAAVSTASSVQVRQPLYSGSVGRWKKYGENLDLLRTALGSLAE